MAKPLIPGLTPATNARLSRLGIDKPEHLTDLSIADLIDAGIGWSQVHRIITFLVREGLAPKFKGPGDSWDDERWKALVEAIVDTDHLVSWEEVAVAVLGELNPPQVGTSRASNPNIQAQYEHRRTMSAVMAWFYAQDGTCQTCGRRIHIEIDHVVGKDAYVKQGRDAADADRLENFQLLCRRCNVVKRESHALGGLTFATAQAALMWILLVERPRTYKAFETLCRAHGMTMASIRFQEAWAMAIWLAKVGAYEIDED
jgi:hypothetical protein